MYVNCSTDAKQYKNHIVQDFFFNDKNSFRILSWMPSIVSLFPERLTHSTRRINMKKNSRHILKKEGCSYA